MVAATTVGAPRRAPREKAAIMGSTPPTDTRPPPPGYYGAPAPQGAPGGADRSVSITRTKSVPLVEEGKANVSWPSSSAVLETVSIVFQTVRSVEYSRAKSFSAPGLQ